MTIEMDLLKMDERQRWAWLLANRGTLIAVGVAWIGLILRELGAGRMPLFLIVMVPVFATLRAGLFLYYCGTPTDAAGGSAPSQHRRRVETAAAALLALALFLPLYSFPEGSANGARQGFAWDLVIDDVYSAPVLALALFWPVATLVLSGPRRPRRLAAAVHLAEPILAALSALIVLWIPEFQWEARALWFVFFLGFESAQPAAGTYVAVIANGLYMLAWFRRTLRP